MVKHLKQGSRLVASVTSIVVIVILAVVAVQLVLAAFSNTIRRLGSESIFQSATVAGGMSLGDSNTDGWILLKPNTNPPTCNSAAEGMLYSKTTDHIVYLCNGTSWSSI